MICDNCIHNGVCTYGENRSNGLYCTGNKCKQFKDKNLFVELPVKVGTTVYYIDWDYTDDDYSDKKVWFIEKIPFTARMIDAWGVDIFATEEEASEQIEKERHK